MSSILHKRRYLLWWLPALRYIAVFLHIPSGGRTALGAEPTMKADIFIFHHNALGLQWLGYIEGSAIFSAGTVIFERSVASSSFGVMVKQSTGQISTQASHSIHLSAVKTVCTSQIEASLCLFKGQFDHQNRVPLRVYGF